MSLSPKLIVETKRSVNSGNAMEDAVLDSIHLSVWDFWETLDRKLWSKTLPGIDVRYGDYVDIELPPDISCSCPPTHEAYRFHDGAFMMKYNTTCFKIQSVASAKYIGYYNAVRYSCFETEEPDGVLSITDAATNQTQRLLFKLKSHFNITWEKYRYDDAPTITVKLLPGKAIDKKQYDNGNRFMLHSEFTKYSDSLFTDFSIQIAYKGWVTTTLVIPVKNGGFDISALHSKWFDCKVE